MIRLVIMYVAEIWALRKKGRGVDGEDRDCSVDSLSIAERAVGNEEMCKIAGVASITERIRETLERKD